jgi:hypothetical protein
MDATNRQEGIRVNEEIRIIRSLAIGRVYLTDNESVLMLKACFSWLGNFDRIKYTWNVSIGADTMDLKQLPGWMRPSMIEDL